jgi:8-oxo-dGTP diphosphatase
VAEPERPRVRVVAAALFEAEELPRHGSDGQDSSDSGRQPRREGDRRVLIAERPAGKHMAGRWEFPGGKVGPGESEFEALRRELREELGISMDAARHCLTLAHAYDDRTVELSMWIVERYRGEACELDGQRLKWVPVEQLQAEDILEADRPFIEALVRNEGSAGSE